VQVIYACREYACTAIDVLARRLRLAFINVHAAEEALPRVIEIMAREHGWTAQKQKACVTALSLPLCSLYLSYCVPVSAFCCQSPAGSTVLSTEFLWTSVVEPSLLPVRRRGTLPRHLRDPVHPTSGLCTITQSRHFSFQSISVHGALGAVFGADALYKLTFYLPYLLASGGRVKPLMNCRLL